MPERSSLGCGTEAYAHISSLCWHLASTVEIPWKRLLLTTKMQAGCNAHGCDLLLCSQLEHNHTTTDPAVSGEASSTATVPAVNAYLLVRADQRGINDRNGVQL